jgi:geranylgeranylglycerol-phosphate geranylgeranyltransferase
LVLAEKDVSSYIGRKLFAHLEMMRPYTLLWCGLVSLAGACIALGSFPTIEIALLATFIPIIGWIAGLCVSDYFDRELDTIEKPHRPLPSGRIKPKEVLGCGVIFAGIGLVLSFYLSILNLLIACVAAALVIGYTRFLKSAGFFGHINRGIITGSAFFFGVFSVTIHIVDVPMYVFLISIVFIIHDINSNLIGALRDIKGDRLGSYRTVPVKYGIRFSIGVSVVFMVMWFLFALGIPVYYRFMNNIYFVLLFVVLFVYIFVYIYLIKNKETLTRRQALTAHEFLVVERITLASAFIFGISSLQTALIIFIPAVTITLLLQYLLREKYEFADAP